MSNISTVVPYIRTKEIEFVADSLKPYKPAHFFFDSLLVDKFVQKASSIKVNAGFDTTELLQDEGLYSANSGGYATVISASPNTIYVNDNFVSLDVSNYGSNISFTSSDFKHGDIVFSSPDVSSNISLNNFSGRVEFFDPTNYVLVLRTLTGTPSNTTNYNSLFNLGNLSGKLANVINVRTNTKFYSDDSVYSVDNITKTFTVDTYTHNHGTISVSGSTINVQLASIPPETANANLIYFTSGTGLGEVRQIQVVSNTSSLVSLNSAITVTGNTTYTLGDAGTNSGPVVDEYGIIAGVFQLPETNTYKFKVGKKIFTIVDSTDEQNTSNQMKSTAEFDASGTISGSDKATPIVAKSPVSVTPNRFTQPRVRSKDPVAQTFYTPDPSSDINNYGIFVSSINLFFRSKPDTGNTEPALPVTVKIVKTSNGYPTDEIVAITSVSCDKINVTDGITTFPNTSDALTYTKFTFSDPVYLLPSQQYAITVQSDSPSYDLWLAELGATVLNDSTNSNRRVSEQPYIGSFFRSQNASTWTPFQNEDLMFVINKAAFSSANPPTLVFNAEAPTFNIGIHSMMLHSSDISFGQANLSYAFKSTLASSLVTETSNTHIEIDKIFNFSSDLKTSSKSVNRKRVILAGNANSMFVSVTMGTNNSDISPLFNSERLSLVTEEYIINSGGISNNNITITSKGGLHSNLANISIAISAPQLSTGVQATANIIASGLVSGNIVAINIINEGSGYVESPTITITETGIASNAKAVIVSENGKSGGNALARYMTKKIILADGFDAGDLRVYVDTIRPQGTDVIAYYKVLSSSDPDQFDDKLWKRMYLENNIISQDTTTPVELVFRPSETGTTLSYAENGITYPLGGKFKYFSVKLVMLAADPSVPPIIKNMRAIALPGG
ncbi:hypothetical protein UFOVP49_8 [uncultured Caudovirales phage]|uniref:Uncharacterized protein n=1 Tax=uncultured Caudovirales phage TaxID=2100421 RepID=A0A6J5KS60_9CAUD|nr:hypothetical protein UFOVP49_8 [uncultured Caudovirales phage]